MKKNRLGLLSILPIALSVSLAACGGGRNESSSAGPVVNEVKVSFYIDFNQPNTDVAYKEVTVRPGEKVTKPDDPTTAPFPDFPIFLGWSEKEIISSTNDLWNFDTNTIPGDKSTFSIYGIWVAQGDN